MQFAQPLWIFAGIFSCVALALVLNRLQKRRLEALTRFASAQLLGRLTRHISPTRRRLKNILLLAAVMLMFVALARPQYGFQWVEVKRKGIDILFALDTSKSMLAEDTRPNRLQRAKLGILDFVEQLEGDRVGLMPFAGSSYLMCPLTLDYDAFAASLNSVSTDIIPLGGTNISELIRSAERVLRNDSNHKILVLITDGEDLEGEAVEAARAAKANGMTIYTVGVGTAKGELIPLPGPQTGFVKDKDGRFVTSRLDEEVLTRIAAATGGIYAPLGSGGEGLEAIYQQKLTLIPKEELAERRHKVPVERFSWPLTAAIILLIIDYLLPERKANGSTKPPVVKTAGRRVKKAPLALLGLAVLYSAPALTPLLTPQWVSAAEGEEAYARGDYLKAAEYYSQALKDGPADPVLHYNSGTTSYKNNLFAQAAASFTEALNSADLELQQKAYFNLGNALFKQGEEKQQANPQAAINDWQEALDAYDSALQLDSRDQLAAENRAYVEKQLEELKKQVEPQPQQPQEDQAEPQEGESEPQDDQQDSQQQDQPSPDQGSGNRQQTEDGEQSESDPQQQPDGADGADGAEQGQDPQPESQESSESGSEEAPAEKPADNPAGSADRQAAEQRDVERRELGKMTREEAENLLNELKGEEGELNFVPGNGTRGASSSGRDW